MLLKALGVPKCEPAAGTVRVAFKAERGRPGCACAAIPLDSGGSGRAGGSAAAFPAAAREQEIALSGKARFVWARSLRSSDSVSVWTSKWPPLAAGRRAPPGRQPGRGRPSGERVRVAVRAPLETVATVNGFGAAVLEAPARPHRWHGNAQSAPNLFTRRCWLTNVAFSAFFFFKYYFVIIIIIIIILTLNSRRPCAARPAAFPSAAPEGALCPTGASSSWHCCRSPRFPRWLSSI